MEERKIEIELFGAKREVYAGNAALRRYRQAGGSMQVLQEVDTDGGNDIDRMLGLVDSFALLIHSNLTDREGVTIDDVMNGFENMQDLVESATNIISGVPWLKNLAAAGSESS